MPKFNVTYEIVTPESATYGEAASRGFAAMAVSLREAVQAIGGHAHEANEWPVYSPAWFTNHNYSEDYQTGAIESRSIHMTDNVTTASRLRIARLLGVRR